MSSADDSMMSFTCESLCPFCNYIMGFGENSLECLCSGYELIQDENLDNQTPNYETETVDINQLCRANMMCSATPTPYELMQACILEVSEYNTSVFDICLDLNLVSCSNYTIN